MKKYALVTLLFIANQAITMENPYKKCLMALIAKSDLDGVRFFTQHGGTSFIDEEAITAAKNKFETVHKPSQTNNLDYCTSNEFCIMIMVQGLAPNNVREKLGLPTSKQ